MPSKLISAHTFAYISLDAMIPQEADQTHIEYGFPVVSNAVSNHPDLVGTVPILTEIPESRLDLNRDAKCPDFEKQRSCKEVIDQNISLNGVYGDSCSDINQTGGFCVCRSSFFVHLTNFLFRDSGKTSRHFENFVWM